MTSQADNSENFESHEREAADGSAAGPKYFISKKKQSFGPYHWKLIFEWNEMELLKGFSYLRQDGSFEPVGNLVKDHGLPPTLTINAMRLAPTGNDKPCPKEKMEALHLLGFPSAEIKLSEELAEHIEKRLKMSDAALDSEDPTYAPPSLPAAGEAADKNKNPNPQAKAVIVEPSLVVAAPEVPGEAETKDTETPKKEVPAIEETASKQTDLEPAALSAEKNPLEKKPEKAPEETSEASDETEAEADEAPESAESEFEYWANQPLREAGVAGSRARSGKSKTALVAAGVVAAFMAMGGGYFYWAGGQSGDGGIEGQASAPNERTPRSADDIDGMTSSDDIAATASQEREDHSAPHGETQAVEEVRSTETEVAEADSVAETPDVLEVADLDPVAMTKAPAADSATQSDSEAVSISSEALALVAEPTLFSLESGLQGQTDPAAENDEEVRTEDEGSEALAETAADAEEAQAEASEAAEVVAVEAEAAVTAATTDESESVEVSAVEADVEDKAQSADESEPAPQTSETSPSEEAIDDEATVEEEPTRPRTRRERFPDFVRPF